MPEPNRNPKVDAYIQKAQPFAQPILAHCAKPSTPDAEVEETIKWSRPFFEYRGTILCNMSAFKEHCSFGFLGSGDRRHPPQSRCSERRRHGLARPHHQRRLLCHQKSSSSHGSLRLRLSSKAANKEAPSPPARASSNRQSRAQNSARFQPGSRQKQKGRRNFCRFQPQLPPRIH